MGEFDPLARKCARVHSVYVPCQRCAESFQLPCQMATKVATLGKCYADYLYILNPILGEKSWIFLDKNCSFELGKFSRGYKCNFSSGH